MKALTKITFVLSKTICSNSRKYLNNFTTITNHHQYGNTYGKMHPFSVSWLLFSCFNFILPPWVLLMEINLWSRMTRRPFRYIYPFFVPFCLTLIEAEDGLEFVKSSIIFSLDSVQWVSPKNKSHERSLTAGFTIKS